MRSKIFRVLEAVEELPAFERLVLIEDRIAQMFDVERDAEADDEHQDDGIEDGEGEPHRIAHDLNGLAARVGPEPREAEAALIRLRRREDFASCAGCRFGRFLVLMAAEAAAASSR